LQQTRPYFSTFPNFGAIDQLESYVRGPRHDMPTCALTRRSPIPQTLAARFA